LRSNDAPSRDGAEKKIRKNHRVKGPLAFLTLSPIDDQSEFLASLGMKIRREGGRYLISVTGAVAIANSIAYVSELIDPKTVFLSLTRKNLMVQSFRYVLWGEGEVGLEVYSTLIKYWSWTPPGDLRPLLILISS
jgi:hypothetical protein